MISIKRFRTSLTITTLIVAAILSACGGGNGSSTGQLTVNLTDAPVDNAQAVVIHFTGATVQADNGGPRNEISVFDPVTKQPGRSIDLLQQNSGKSTVLFDQTLPAGRYSWIRLAIDFDPQKTYIQIDGNRYPLNCVSCEKTGLKLNRSFTVKTDNPLSLTLDFDLRKSITDPASDNTFKLRPTVRIVDTAPAGLITGEIDSTLISQLGGIDGCNVYVYEGSNVTPGDIYLLPDGSTPPGVDNPVTTTAVIVNNSHYEYRAAYLPAGDYTVALTCDGELDNPLLKDTNMVFSEPVNVSVTPGEISTINFNVPPPV